MRAEGSLTVECIDGRASLSLANVLAPDNDGAPRGLRLTMGGQGKEVHFKLGADSPDTAMSTFVALLNDITLFQEVWLLSTRRRR